MKAANGKRSNFRVPYGYKRDELDKEKWLVDEAAAVSYTHLDVYKRQALNDGVPAAADLFTVVQLRCRAIGAVFLPPCTLHQEILLADLASPCLLYTSRCV